MRSLEEVADWILEHRRDRAFKDYTKSNVMDELVFSIRKGAALIVTENEQIVGVICGDTNPEIKEFYVYDILAESKTALIKMLEFFIRIYPDFLIKGKRGERIRVFKDPVKLRQRLSYGK